MELLLEVVGMGKKALGPAAVHRFNNHGGVIGRGAECDWVLPDPARRLSGRHAIVSHQKGRFFLTDISKNGIYLGVNHRLPKNEPIAVADGSVFFVGALGIRANVLSASGAEETPAPTKETRLGNQNPTQVLIDQVAAKFKNNGHSSLATAKTTPDRVSFDASQGASLINSQQATRLKSAMASGLNIPFQQVEKLPLEPLVYQLAVSVRLFMRGMVDTWQSRSQLKSQLKQELTLVGEANNNPFKFAANEHQAIASLLHSSETDSDALASAIAQCFKDIEAHQTSSHDGVEQAVRSLLYLLSPDRVARATESEGKSKWSFGLGRINRWKQYCQYHRQLANNPNLASELAELGTLQGEAKGQSAEWEES